MQIDKDIPIPAVRRAASAIKYPLREMEIGDSFFVAPDPDIELDTVAAVARRVRAACNHYRDTSKAAGEPTREFVVRTLGDGIRCWRTE